MTCDEGFDCAGVCGGTAVVDECGECGGNNDAYCLDDGQTCIDGDMCLSDVCDACGECGTDNPVDCHEDGESCEEDNECETGACDDCGICAGENADNVGCGCFVAAALTYCEDTDGDGLGDIATSTDYCEIDVPDESWVMDCTDPEPECATDDTDSCGVCAGGNAADLGCGCFNPAAQQYWYD